MTVTVGLILLSLYTCTLGNPVSVCLPNHSCLPIPECHINLDDVVYPCDEGRNICCANPKTQNYSTKFTEQAKKINSTPSDNGLRDNYNEKPNFNDGNGESAIDETQEFVRNASLSGFISNRPIKNYNTYDPKATTRTPITAGSFEDVRFNIPNYNQEFERKDVHGTKNYENKKKISEEDKNFAVLRRSIFKENCGLTFADNKVTGGRVAELGQFPWMALLAFRQAAQPVPQFLCGGTLITTRHILTAAHCIIENRPLELVFVRLGEYNLTSQRDCVNFGNRRVCADQHTDVYVERVAVHPEYSRQTLKNDIALIRLRHSVRESDYIRAICLPFDKHWSYSELTGQNFTVSGWGKSDSGNLFGSDVLQFAKVKTWDQHKCNNSIPTQVKPLSEMQLCANGPNTEDACKGDSGGPLMNITLDKSLEVRYIQVGIVSFGTATCGDKNLPTIYTRVDKYLKWIVENAT
ncbi:phenoloxidase-activating factor 3-like [Harmonia axyridis]|uniref:phenoloxidase-activating factor 3-like n=1 Tax=Harmonia axyridis TaxID=115357 RepID=UPI001E276EDD|nr:phenoloxidase-activating factor 3-like [Harmonia axyridis]